MSAEDRKRQLIEIAIDLFSRKGFAGTTTKEIAAAAGITEAIVFRHFATKRDFYTAILDHINSAQSTDEWLSSMQRLIDAKDDAGLFRLIIHQIVAAVRKEPRFERLMILAAMEGHEIAELHMQRFAMPIGCRLTEYLAQRQADGALVPGNPHAMLVCVAGAAQFYAMHRYVFASKKVAHADTDQAIDDLAKFITLGLLAPTNQERQ